jgi:hypothetical protein
VGKLNEKLFTWKIRKVFQLLDTHGQTMHKGLVERVRDTDKCASQKKE